jgi:hypothetical protein
MSLITEIKNYRMRLEELVSGISDNQFLLHILNNMMDNYDSQLAMMEKRLTDKSNPSTLSGIQNDFKPEIHKIN